MAPFMGLDPAITTSFCPCWTCPLERRRASPCAIHSSVLRTLATFKGVTPHASASLSHTVWEGESAKMGPEGRCFEAMIAEERMVDAKMEA